MRCGFGQCPAVFELPDGSLVVIGRDPDIALTSLLAGKVGHGEHAVVISPALLANLKADDQEEVESGEAATHA
jgi:hypothetical protein